jgi:hypothetical protein
MKIIKVFLELLGAVALGVIVHEFYHLAFSQKVQKICYDFTKGFTVFSHKGTGELIPYLLQIGVFLICLIIIFRRGHEKDRDRW